jgi:hypothetical protein
MEVHKRPHHVTHKKQWGEYLLEFFMLFLAVFLGFVAENIRENIVEHHRENEYIHSMLNDLKTDTTKLNKNLKVFQAQYLMQDTAIKLLPSLQDGFSDAFYTNFKSFESYPDFIYTDATIQQLKNSGGFRLIRNHQVVDSIMHYDGLVKQALINEAELGKVLDKTDEYNNEIFNRSELLNKLHNGILSKQLELEKFDYLLTHDKLSLSRYSNQLLYHRKLSEITRANMQNVKSAAERLIVFLQREYDVE